MVGHCPRLTDTHHVYGLDPRGHGESERRPTDVSRAAHVADAVTALRAIGRATVVGQSLGGHTALLTAARHPDLVFRLVLAEAVPQGPDDETAGMAGRLVPGLRPRRHGGHRRGSRRGTLGRVRPDPLSDPGRPGRRRRAAPRRVRPDAATSHGHRRGDSRGRPRRAPRQPSALADRRH
ncbi:alpha/beta fold hydrolase [Micromonospora sp. NPDC050187]|uniref:alpha/beta fold hydrolase n=1 Tax=Micromonospora sp. NPDC050187 TaxID=3364277 RepID=UPI0037963DBA